MPKACECCPFSQKKPPKAACGGPAPSDSEARGRSVQRSRNGSHAAPAASTRCERQRTQAGVQPAGHTRPKSGCPGAVQAGEASSGAAPQAAFSRRCGEGRGGPDRECNDRDRGEDTGAVVALGSAASSPVQRACSAKRKKRVAGGGRAQHHISPVRSTGECGAELWTLTRYFPPRAGIRAETTRWPGEHGVRVRITGRRRKSPGLRWCGGGVVVVAGPCKASAGPTRRQRGGPDSARAEPARACRSGSERASPGRTRRECDGATQSAGPAQPDRSSDLQGIAADQNNATSREEVKGTWDWSCLWDLAGMSGSSKGREEGGWREVEDDPAACGTRCENRNCCWPGPDRLGVARRKDGSGRALPTFQAVAGRSRRIARGRTRRPRRGR